MHLTSATELAMRAAHADALDYDGSLPRLAALELSDGEIIDAIDALTIALDALTALAALRATDANAEDAPHLRLRSASPFAIPFIRRNA